MTALSPLAQVEVTSISAQGRFNDGSTDSRKRNPTGTEPKVRLEKSANGCEVVRSHDPRSTAVMRRVHFDPEPIMTTALMVPFPDIRSLLTRAPEMAYGSKESDPPFPFPPGEKPGRAGSPHAGSTLPASKRRWHPSMLPAPPTRGLPPPCESPAEQPCRPWTESRTKERPTNEGGKFNKNT